MGYLCLLAVLYGVLEGITEWLPVSSTGHLILLNRLLPKTLDAAFFSLFEVVVQLGAMLAVVVLFFPRLCPFCHKKGVRAPVLRLWALVAVAVMPAALIGALLGDRIEALLFSPLVVGVALIVYGVVFLLLSRVGRNPSVKRAEEMTLRHALFIGCFQVLALVPGTSRSGATITGALCLGISRPAASEFSFFLGVPTMLGAGALSVLRFVRAGGVLSPENALFLAVGTLVSFLVSLISIKFLLGFVKRHTFAPFGVYRILLGAAVLLFLV